jgi:uncharacterized RDD family membrane protein YckC
VAVTARRPVTVFPPAAAERQGMRAGVVSRVAVMVIDALVVTADTVLLYLVWAGIRFLWLRGSFSWPNVSLPEMFTVGSIVCVVYLTSGWASTGRTAGKRLVGLRVVDVEGQRLRMRGAFLRALACTYIPIGLLWCAVSSKNRSLQDIVLRTSVIYDWQSKVLPHGPRHPADASAASDDALGSGVDVAASVADEPDDGHAEALPRLDGE